MRAAIAGSIRVAGWVFAACVSASTMAWGACPTSPNYSPDFTNNQSCLSLNETNTNTPPYTGSPSFQKPSTSTMLQLTANQGSWATSAWYNTPQVVASGFSSTFSFQIGNTSATGQTPNGDGIAFVIQNSPAGTSSGLAALGPGGCGIGFGQSASGCAPASGGIPNSVAIEFNTFNNGSGVDPSSDDVTIQNCGSAANSVDQSCSLKYKDLTNTINLSDNNVHVATVTYTPTAAFGCSAANGCGTLDVVVDGIDLFPGGVPFDITSIGLTGCSAGTPAACTAYAGFTAATGGSNDIQSIASWTFTPTGQSQSGTVTPGTSGQPGPTTTFNINGGFTAGSNTSGYDFTAQETTTSQSLNMVVTAIPMSQAACNSLVRVNPLFSTANCFVYQNGGGQNQDTSVLFEVTCPPNGSCGSNANPFEANLGTDFNFNCIENAPLQCGPVPAPFSFGFPNLTSSNGLPEIGFLKGEGPDALHPCTPSTNPAIPLFQSNQISTFVLGDVSGVIHGGSGGTTSCWTMTYLTQNELPSVTITQPVNGALYLQGENDAKTQAIYSCSPDSAGSASPVGPYLSVSTCTGPVSTSSPFDTSTLGPHTFTVQAEDSATNTNQQSVTYIVVTGATPASGTKCNGVYYGTFKGNITIASGQSCRFVGGGVTGSITDLGGNLAITNATVGGNVSIASGTYSIGPSTVIKGNLTILATSGAGAPNQVCGASIAGGLTFSLNASPVSIGSSSAACPGNTISGNLVVSGNLAATAIYNNTVGGGLLDQLNLRPTQVFNNHVTGILSCSGDSSITGGGNTAVKKQGQCASF